MPQTSLEFTVGPGGWLQANTRDERGQLESIVAVRLRPDADGNWGPDGALYVMPPTQEKLRALPLRRIVMAVAASEGLRERLAEGFDKKAPPPGDDLLKALSGFVHPEFPLLERPEGRNLPDEFYATVADRYRDAFARGLNPRSAIAEAASVSTDVAGRWVREARKRGFLPPTEPGKARV
jgi:hypothetical protein